MANAAIDENKELKLEVAMLRKNVSALTSQVTNLLSQVKTGVIDSMSAFQEVCAHSLLHHYRALAHGATNNAIGTSHIHDFTSHSRYLSLVRVRT